MQNTKIDDVPSKHATSFRRRPNVIYGGITEACGPIDPESTPYLRRALWRRSKRVCVVFTSIRSPDVGPMTLVIMINYRVSYFPRILYIYMYIKLCFKRVC